jgi:hypothetical protein
MVGQARGQGGHVAVGMEARAGTWVGMVDGGAGTWAGGHVTGGWRPGQARGQGGVSMAGMIDGGTGTG